MDSVVYASPVNGTSRKVTLPERAQGIWTLRSEFPGTTPKDWDPSSERRAMRTS